MDQYSEGGLLAKSVVLHPCAWMDKNRDFESFLGRTSELVEKTKESINKSGRFDPERSDFDYCLSLIVCRIQRFSRSILILLYEGNAEGSFVLLRAVYEDLFQLGYLVTDPEKLGSQCRNYGLIDGLVHLQYRRQIGGSKTDDLDEVLSDFRRKYHQIVDEFTVSRRGKADLAADYLDRKYYDNWTKLDMASVAKKAGLLDHYETTYKYCLSYVHGGRRLQEQFATRNKEGNLVAIDPNKEPEDEDIRHVLRQLSLGHLLLTEILCKAYAIDISSDYHKLDDGWKQLALEDA